MNHSLLRVLMTSLAVLSLAFLFAVPLRAADDAAAQYKSKCAACHGADGSGDTPTGKAMKVIDLCSDEVQKQGFYDYHENSDNVPQDIFPPPSFSGNLVTLSVKYAF